MKLITLFTTHSKQPMPLRFGDISHSKTKSDAIVTSISYSPFFAPIFYAPPNMDIVFSRWYNADNFCGHYGFGVIVPLCCSIVRNIQRTKKAHFEGGGGRMINAQIVLKTLCSVAKTSQEDLADALGISVTQAKRILKGSYDLPKFIKQDEFAQIFGRYCTDYFASDSKRMVDEYLISFRDEITDREYQEIEGIYRRGSYEALIKELWRKSYPDPNKNKRHTDDETPPAISGEPRPKTGHTSVSAGFTLRSLKAMLTGGDVDGENWVAALPGQGKAGGQKPPESAHTPIILTDFEDDGAFLRSVFPESILEILGQAHPAAVMDGTCKNDIKSRICRQLGSDCGISMRSLVKKCAALLEMADLNAFHAATAYLFSVLGEEAQAFRRLHSCYRRCSDDNRTSLGLAVLTVFALLGPEHFLRLIPKESDYSLFEQ